MASNKNDKTKQHDDEARMIEQLLDDLDWKGQMGQMIQMDINLLLNDDRTAFNQTLLDHFIGTLGVGSVLNTVSLVDHDHGTSFPYHAQDFRTMVLQLQQTAEAFGRPPVIWGLDSVHGANYIQDAVTTPQPINLASSFNTTLALQAGQWASRDTRRAGINWLFSPLLGLSWQPLWSRVYETFGEDPLVVGHMAQAMIHGIQLVGEDSEVLPSRAAACAKHWVGYSMPRDGHDRAPSWIPNRHLHQYFLPPWKDVLQEVYTVMESYTETNGVPNVVNRQTTNSILRHHEFKFEGLLVTDYNEIINAMQWHHVAPNLPNAIQQTLQEGTVDMAMVGYTNVDAFYEAFQGLLENTIDNVNLQERIRTSARRALLLKQRLNMFQETADVLAAWKEDEKFDNMDDDLQALLEMTQQTITLTENKDNTLPLDSTKPLNILVTGPTSHSMSFQSGGWTFQWQGMDNNDNRNWFPHGSTIRQAMSEKSTWQITYECGVDINGNDCSNNGPSGRSSSGDDDDLDALEQEHATSKEQQQQSGGVMNTIKGWVGGWQQPPESLSLERAVKAVNGQDVILVCIGEVNYTEKPGDIRDLSLPPGQYELVAALREAAPPTTKIVLVYLGGRPRLLADVVDLCDAVLVGFLPGPMTGEAMVNLLNGNVNPSAKLPLTYPKWQDGGGIPYLHSVSDLCTTDGGWSNVPCDVQWPFGHGLSYTTFQYDNIVLPDNHIVQYHHSLRGENNNNNKSKDDTFSISVTVTNTGSMAGAETVLLFTFDESRSVTPEYKRLRGFQKVWLEPSASTEVTFEIPVEDLRLIGPHDDTHLIFQDGMTFRVGFGAETDCRVSKDDDPLSSEPIQFQIMVDDDYEYSGACEAACGLWDTSGCSHELVDMDMDHCWDACTSIHKDSSGILEMNNDGWGWNYVNCLESVVWSESFHSDTDCWKLTNFCRNVLATPMMDEHGSGPTPATFGSPVGTAGLVMALISGVLASFMVFYSMRGGFRPKQDDPYGDVQFSRVRDHEPLETLS